MTVTGNDEDDDGVVVVRWKAPPKQVKKLHYLC